jgi:hypothetical protein
MDLIYMYPSCVPDPVSLLWKEGGGKNETDVMPSKVIGLSQVLELFDIRIWVSGERAKVLFYLREVSKGKGNMDPHNAFHSSHFLERVDGNWLTWKLHESEWVGGSWDPVALGGQKDGWKSEQEVQKEGQKERQKEGWGKGQKEGWGLTDD